MEERYKNIINMILRYFSINDIELLNEKDHKEELYILLLVLNSCGMFYDKRVMKSNDMTSLRNVKRNLLKAEEKLLINREFRKRYFDFEDKVKDIM